MISDVVHTKVGDYNVNYREYTDYSEYVKHVRDNTVGKENRASLKTDDPEWSGTATIEDAYALAEYGWAEGYKKMKVLSGDFKTHQGFLPEITRDVCGEFVDVDTYLRGEPECMFTFNGFKPAKFLRLIINTGGNCNISSDMIYERGSILVNMIDSLESHGVRCEIWASMAVVNSSDKYVRRTKLKDFHEKFNIEKMTYCLCNASWHRRLGFAEKEANSESVRDNFGFHSGNGYSRTCDDPMPMKEGDIFISLEEGDYKEALDKLKKTYMPE